MIVLIWRVFRNAGKMVSGQRTGILGDTSAEAIRTAGLLPAGFNKKNFYILCFGSEITSKKMYESKKENEGIIQVHRHKSSHRYLRLP